MLNQVRASRKHSRSQQPCLAAMQREVCAQGGKLTSCLLNLESTLDMLDITLWRPVTSESCKQQVLLHRLAADDVQGA